MECMEESMPWTPMDFTHSGAAAGDDTPAGPVDMQPTAAAQLQHRPFDTAAMQREHLSRRCLRDALIRLTAESEGLVRAAHQAAAAASWTAANGEAVHAATTAAELDCPYQEQQGQLLEPRDTVAAAAHDGIDGVLGSWGSAVSSPAASRHVSTAGTPARHQLPADHHNNMDAATENTSPRASAGGAYAAHMRLSGSGADPHTSSPRLSSRLSAVTKLQAAYGSGSLSSWGSGLGVSAMDVAGSMPLVTSGAVDNDNSTLAEQLATALQRIEVLTNEQRELQMANLRLKSTARHIAERALVLAESVRRVEVLAATAMGTPAEVMGSALMAAGDDTRLSDDASKPLLLDAPM